MLEKESLFVENQTEHTNMFCGQNAEYRMFEQSPLSFKQIRQI
jgi:hypothetical protein